MTFSLYRTRLPPSTLLCVYTSHRICANLRIESRAGWFPLGDANYCIRAPCSNNSWSDDDRSRRSYTWFFLWNRIVTINKYLRQSAPLCHILGVLGVTSSGSVWHTRTSHWNRPRCRRGPLDAARHKQEWWTDGRFATTHESVFKSSQVK